MPILRISAAKLRHNLTYVKTLCQRRGAELMGVVKGCHAHPGICRIFAEAGVLNLGAARVRHAAPIAAAGGSPWMVALPPLHRAGDVVRGFPVSFNSEIAVLDALSRAAAEAGIRHEAMLMVEVGDLREGVMPGQVVDVARRCLELEHEFFAFHGLAAHFGCMSGLIPTPESVDRLIRAGGAVQAALGRRPAVLSVGGSDFLRLLEAGPLHPGITQVRMGYAMLLGKHPDSLDGHPHLARDAVLFEAEVLEVCRLRLCDGEPVMLEYNRFPGTFTFLETEPLTGSLYEVLRAHGYIPSRATHDIALGHATPAMSRHLGTAAGEALMLLDEMVFDQQDRPLHTSRQWIRGDRYIFRI